jgi:hypothetical protein
MDSTDKARVRNLVRVTTAGLAALLVEWILMAFLWSDAGSSIRTWLGIGLTLSVGLTFIPLVFVEVIIWKRKLRQQR